MTIDPADVLALLEAGPELSKDLAKWLGVSRQALRPLLRQLQREGSIRQLVRDGRFALTGYVVPHAAERVPVPERAATATRVERGKTIRVVDGVEYEIRTLDDLIAERAEHWPSKGGSSLSVGEMRIDVRR